MKMNTTLSIKFLRLKRELLLSHWQAVGLLESIWVFVAGNAMDGGIGRFTNEDIAAAIEWAGDPDEMVEALVKTGWLDKHPECRLCVHDWEEHCPTFIKGNMSKKGKRFFSSTPASRSDGAATQFDGASNQSATVLSRPSDGSATVLSRPSDGSAPVLSRSSDASATVLSRSSDPPDGGANASAGHVPILGYSSKGNSSLAKGGQAAPPEPAHHLTTTWNFYARGSRPGNETFPKVIEVFAEALRRGLKPATIQAAIEDPKRDRTEPLFLFSDRELRPQQRKGPATPKSTEELLDAMTADSRQRDVLEVAYHGRN